MERFSIKNPGAKWSLVRTGQSRGREKWSEVVNSFGNSGLSRRDQEGTARKGGGSFRRATSLGHFLPLPSHPPPPSR